ncbi:hypothetical protein Bca52824_080453 [Brassica carinata]|uniref:Indole-3-acetic acid-amido synthetase GH3.17-like n=1 Tax=Brassica carinata TaxID=52824 RepID=A0A8X7PGM7_BRACI|nr:hypothetical protein Bca52824_080453 [Brassica carinata]
MTSSFKLSDLEEVTTNAEKIQNDLLKEILTLNAKTEYLRQFLHGSSDKTFFKKHVPVVSYEDMKPYIERVADGEPSEIISGGPITKFLRSSGTSGEGKQKIFPVNDDFAKKMGYILALRSLVMHSKDTSAEEGKSMEFHYIKPEYTTLSGLPISTRDQVVKVRASFAYTLVRAINFLEKYWKELCSNIRSGHVSDWITDLNCRNSVSVILGGPNPELADLIEKICSHKSWEGIITRLWPKSRSLEAIFTGQMAQYIPILEFYSNKLPQVSTVYGCSESTFGFNVDPLSKPQDVSYTFLPNISYFEFLPIDHERDIASIVDLVNVKQGCYYEPVVVGFYNSTPQFRFVRRKNIVLSVETEMTTEEDILKALARASLVLESSSDVMLMGFTCYADVSTFPGHYVFYWELKARAIKDVEPDKKVLVECCSVLEESFDALYRRLRSKGGVIGALEIRVVQKGTFDSLMEYFTSEGGSTAQYKTPICINSSEALAVLESKVLSRFYSERSPPLDS